MEQISALMDGELEHDEAAGLVPVLKQRVDLREAWSSYHLIGEALRGERCGGNGGGFGRAPRASRRRQP